jgi:death-on-curing protein
VERNARLEDDMVAVAEGVLDVQAFADILALIALGDDPS